MTYICELFGSKIARHAPVECRTITEARQCAESYGDTADGATIRDRKGRIVASHLRDRNGDGSRWFRATI